MNKCITCGKTSDEIKAIIRGYLADQIAAKEKEINEINIINSTNMQINEKRNSAIKDFLMNIPDELARLDYTEAQNIVSQISNKSFISLLEYLKSLETTSPNIGSRKLNNRIYINKLQTNQSVMSICESLLQEKVAIVSSKFQEESIQNMKTTISNLETVDYLTEYKLPIQTNGELFFQSNNLSEKQFHIDIELYQCKLCSYPIRMVYRSIH